MPQSLYSSLLHNASNTFQSKDGHPSQLQILFHLKLPKGPCHWISVIEILSEGNEEVRVLNTHRILFYSAQPFNQPGAVSSTL